ncbi:MAG TPA: hypothetical protein VEN29_18565 [Casimicrobiaceae bacterium]|nr:hypothetical protein [Casimicrobiaceae bacterium]
MVSGRSGPNIVCKQEPNDTKLQVWVRVKNFGRTGSRFFIFGTISGNAGPFWIQFDVTSTKGSEANVTKTYFVNSGWAYEGTSTSGAEFPQDGSLPGGVLAPGQEADVIVTYESRSSNLAAAEARKDGRPTQNIDAANDGPPFYVHVVTNSPDPGNPQAPVPNIGIGDQSATCQTVQPQ